MSKMPHSDPGMESDRKALAGGSSASVTASEKWGSYENGVPDVLQSTTSWTSS